MDWSRHVERFIASTYGERVSIAAKAKFLNKFGRTANADAAVRTTVGMFHGAEVNETFAAGNTVDEVVSSAADAGEIIVEGHFLDGNDDLQFAMQEVTLTGLTPAALDPVLARVSRMKRKAGTFAAPAVPLTGLVAAYDSSATTITSGVPQTSSAVKCMIVAGLQQSRKCATALGVDDYWCITGATAGIERGAGSPVNADIEVEYRKLGGVWLPAIEMEMDLRSASLPWDHIEFSPWRVVPSNSDVRMIVTTDTADTVVDGALHGVLALRM